MMYQLFNTEHPGMVSVRSYGRRVNLMNISFTKLGEVCLPGICVIGGEEYYVIREKESF